MKRKKKHDEHIDESWLIPYADILTLLLALFIVLFASSQIDQKKFQAVAESFASELDGGTGILDSNSPTDMEDDGTSSQIPSIIDQEAEKDDTETEAGAGGESDIEIDAEELYTAAQDQKELEEMQQAFQQFAEDKGIESRVTTELDDRGLVVKLREGVLYESGSADLNAKAATLAREISKMFESEVPRTIYIEGHTDNVPTNQSEYPTNWELSSARAINFMKIILENSELDPRKFSATGYGEYRPVAANDTKQGRAENRRVEIVISRFVEQELEE
ncbi:flagellar motor protein MotB [Chryseomicrobium excrementi]|uniref:Flagellar motor protein MotB n=1 Tax=Chryseomicrobium excrementi TaxID=2041346 RepID=A0A2M9F0N9_9BACL|nr:flagellar motor protein MotB [Chryseomicrobium excrementi]PJK17028.1 flagellar motor protein MotB [Chryseomicrobium excrementi]